MYLHAYTLYIVEYKSISLKHHVHIYYHKKRPIMNTVDVDSVRSHEYFKNSLLDTRFQKSFSCAEIFCAPISHTLQLETEGIKVDITYNFLKLNGYGL